MDRQETAGNDLRELTAAAGGYLRESRSFAFSIVSMLPLIVLYHCGIVQSGYGQRNLAEVWLTGPLSVIGVEAAQVLNIALIAAVVAVLWRSPRSEWLHWRTAAIMVAEACLYAAALYKGVPALAGIVDQRASRVIFAIGLGRVAPGVGPACLLAIGRVAPGTGPACPLAIGRVAPVLLALGAGVYEELLFRLLMVGGGAWALTRALGWTAFRSTLVMLVVSSVCFAAVHHIGPLGEPFGSYNFIFRTLCGLLLGIVFLGRGLGVAVWTHAIFNGLVLLQGAG
jgi:hypothetical protein